MQDCPYCPPTYFGLSLPRLWMCSGCGALFCLSHVERHREDCRNPPTSKGVK